MILQALNQVLGGFYVVVASISGWYFFIMYDDIAGLKPGTRGDSTQQLLV